MTFAAWLAMSMFAFSVQAAPVDATQGRALAPAGAFDSDTTDAASSAAGTAAAAEAANNGSSAGAGNTGAKSTPVSGSPAVQAAAPKEAVSSAKPTDIDFRRAVRDAAKPVLDDLAHSAVAEAVRGLAGDPSAANADLTGGDGTAGSANGERRRSWDGQQNAGSDADGDGTGRRPRTEAELATDKVKATFLLEALFREVAPWAIAAAVLYGLFYMARFVFALRRRVKADKRQRRMNDRHRRSHSTRGSPTRH